MKYRENNYFNNNDEYLIRDDTLKLNFISKLHSFNGSFFCNEKLQYKMTSVKCININELLN